MAKRLKALWTTVKSGLDWSLRNKCCSLDPFLAVWKSRRNEASVYCVQVTIK